MTLRSLAVAAALLMPIGAPHLAAAADSPRCAIAASLIVTGAPREAAELIDEIRVKTESPNACAAEGTEAAGAIAEAQSLLVQAHQAAARKKPDWDKVKELSQKALEIDASLKSAKLLEQRAEEPLLTQQARTHSEAWQDWVEDSGRHLAILATAALTGVGVLVLLARLLLLLPATRRRCRVPWPTTCGLLFGAVAASLGMACLVGPDGFGWKSILAFVSATVSLYLLWSGLALRKRVRIDMLSDGKAAEDGATAIVTHLRHLGQDPPDGLEIPLGPDEDVLAGSSITSQVKGLLALAVSMVQDLLSVTPWRVRVDAPDSGGKSGQTETHVVITRHGRTVGAEIISPHPFGPDGPQVDVWKQVAAFALQTISSQYLAPDQPPRASWRAVGWQYAAAGMGDRDQQVKVLTAACNEDPDYFLATYSLWMAKYREEANPLLLTRARDWMTNNIGLADSQALKARMRYAAVIFDRNRSAGPDQDPPDPELLVELTAAVEGIDPQTEGRLLRPFNEAVRALSAAANEVTEVSVSNLAQSPQSAYSRACIAARAENVAPAIAHLRLAFADPKLREWSTKDPELGWLRGQPAYREAFPTDPPQDFLTEPPFKPHAQLLKQNGWSSLEALAYAPVPLLASALGITAARAGTLRAWARRALSIPSDLSSWKLFIVQEALTLGIEPVGAVPDEDLAAFKAELIVNAAERGYAMPVAALDAWTDWGS